MGKYVNHTTNGPVGTSANDKKNAIIADGGVEIPKPDQFVENLVCVVDNGLFGAAAYAYSEQEFKSFNISSDTRPKVWLIWDKVKDFAM